MERQELRAGDRVHLVCPAGVDAWFVVDAAVEGEIAILRSLDPEGRQLARAIPEGLAVDITVPIGSGARVGATLVQRITHPGGLIVLDNRPFLTQVNRRASYRVEVQLDLCLSYVEGDALVQLPGRSVNLSIGGVAASVRRPPPAGTEVAITLRLPTGPVDVKGVVVGTDAPAGADVRVRFCERHHERSVGPFVAKVETSRARTRLV